MDEFVRWLKAQIDEDEAAALGTLDISRRAAMKRGEPVPRWEYEPDGSIRDQKGMARMARVKFTWSDSAAHIVRHDPARVLLEIESKRELLYAVVSAKHDYDHWHARPPADRDTRVETLAKMTGRWSAWKFVATQLAAPYADRDGYAEALAALG